MRTSSNFLINQSVFHTLSSVSIEAAATDSFTVLGTGGAGVRSEGDDKFTAIGVLKSNRSLTDDNQANQLSAFSEVES